MAKFKFFSVGGEADTDTNTNLANANLTADNNTRDYTLASSGTLNFKDSAGDKILSMLGAGGVSNLVFIGEGSETWALPNERPDTAGELMVSYNTNGGLRFSKIRNYNSATYIGRDTTWANGNMIIFGQAGVLDIGTGSGVSFASASRTSPVIPSSTTQKYYRAKAGLSITEEGLSNVNLFMVEVEPNNTTSFDYTSGQTDLGDFTLGGVGEADTIKTTEFNVDGTGTAMDENKWYFFGMKNGSGSTITNLCIWITITWTNEVFED